MTVEPESTVFLFIIIIKKFNVYICCIYKIYTYICGHFKTNEMKTFNYYYGNQPITKSEFERNVPENWQEQIENYEFSYGYFKAVERD